MTVKQNNFMRLIDNMLHAVYFTDRNGTVTSWNKAAELTTGYTAAEVVGKRFNEILMHMGENGTPLDPAHSSLTACMLDGETHNSIMFLHHKQGHRIAVSVRDLPLMDDEGSIAGAAEFFTVHTEMDALKHRISELEKLALIDKLTKLSNRKHSEMVLESILQEKQRHDLSFGILLIDIDDFKELNDTYGHTVGDRAIQIIANTLRHSIRAFDHLGRWSGEQFIAIFRNADVAALNAVGNKCRSLIEQSHFSSGTEWLNRTVSVGGTTGRTNDTVESLLKRADQLLYTSKYMGKNRITVD